MSWHDLIFKNFWWKLFSLLFAMIVWSTYHINDGSFSLGALYNESTTREWSTRPRLLTRLNDPHRYKAMPEEVSITLVGRRALIGTLNLKEVIVFVDVQEYVVGGTNLLTVQVRTPQGSVLNTRVNPRKVLVQQLEPEFRPTH